MARVLFAWELGGGLGHVRRMLPIAAALREQGHSTAFAFRDARALHAPLEAGHEVFAAPRLASPPRRELSPASHADILLNQGFDDVPSLRAAFRAWRQMFTLWEADAIVCDYAPSAQIVARRDGLPCVTTGSGFALPPRASPLPALRDWEPADAARLAERDARLAQRVREALEGDGPDAASRLFDADAHLLFTVADLDPFGPRPQQVEYFGLPDDAEGGLPARWSGQARPRVFAYLKPDGPDFDALLAALRSLDGEAIIAAPGLAARAAQERSNERLQVLPGAVALADLLGEADLCLCHGGPGIVARALLAGVPVAVAPLQLEHFLVGRRAAALGAGRVRRPGEERGDLATWLASTARDEALRDGARAAARRFMELPRASAADAARRIAAVSAR